MCVQRIFPDLTNRNSIWSIQVVEGNVKMKVKIRLNSPDVRVGCLGCLCSEAAHCYQGRPISRFVASEMEADSTTMYPRPIQYAHTRPQSDSNYNLSPL